MHTTRAVAHPLDPLTADESSRAAEALVIQHEQPAPGGYVNQWLEDRGVEQDVLRIDIEDRQVDPLSYDLVVSLGSGLSSFDDIPWVRREESMLREAHDGDIPILGVCFGGQLLAKALGGDAFRSEHAEIGWLPVRTRDESLVSKGPWLQWHFDRFTLPPGARLIADSPMALQAYVTGRSMGIQFHPEVTPEIVEAWVLAYPQELEQEGVDPQRLLDETYERANETRAAAWQLFDAFLDRIAGVAREALRGR